MAPSSSHNRSLYGQGDAPTESQPPVSVDTSHTRDPKSLGPSEVLHQGLWTWETRRMGLNPGCTPAPLKVGAGKEAVRRGWVMELKARETSLLFEVK